MNKSLAFGALALAFCAAAPAYAQSSADSTRQNAAEAGGSAGTIAGSTATPRADQGYSQNDSRARTERLGPKTIGNPPPAERTEAGGGAR